MRSFPLKTLKDIFGSSVEVELYIALETLRQEFCKRAEEDCTGCALKWQTCSNMYSRSKIFFKAYLEKLEEQQDDRSTAN